MWNEWKKAFDLWENATAGLIARTAQSSKERTVTALRICKFLKGSSCVCKAIDGTYRSDHQ